MLRWIMKTPPGDKMNYYCNDNNGFIVRIGQGGLEIEGALKESLSFDERMSSKESHN